MATSVVGTPQQLPDMKPTLHPHFCSYPIAAQLNRQTAESEGSSALSSSVSDCPPEKPGTRWRWRSSHERKEPPVGAALPHVAQRKGGRLPL
ncbi:hypothetical protein EYF80_014064 [Liparis tanakae]|uniref:Uncharacterized protein n=1 Tax=Liparis tanakae TaxID=230148 RepID=A0A4Z2ID97_9TELE|nr:hypothetical protein EYF80_014064 [Liparis tanakae]